MRDHLDARELDLGVDAARQREHRVEAGRRQQDDAEQDRAGVAGGEARRRSRLAGRAWPSRRGRGRRRRARSHPPSRPRRPRPPPASPGRASPAAAPPRPSSRRRPRARSRPCRPPRRGSPPPGGRSGRPSSSRARCSPRRTCRPSAGHRGSPPGSARGPRSWQDRRPARPRPPGRRTSGQATRRSRRRRPGRRGRGPGGRPRRAPRPRRVTTFAISTTGCPGVPSTCSPTPTKRFTTCPAIGDVSRARSTWRWARLTPASACSTPAAAAARARLRVLDLLARGDAALEEALDARELELRGLERRPRLRQRGAGLPRLILQRQGVDLGHDLAGADRVALGHPHRDDAAGHERRELHVLVRRRGDGTAHHERLDEVALHHLRRRGLDRRHRLRGHLFFAAAARATGGDERERAQRRRERATRSPTRSVRQARPPGRPAPTDARGARRAPRS